MFDFETYEDPIQDRQDRRAGSRTRRGWLSWPLALLMLLGGFAGGSLTAGDGAELKAVHARVQQAERQIQALGRDLEAARQKNADLSKTLKQDEASAASSASAAHAAQRRLHARMAKLDKREKALDVREHTLDAREQSLAASNAGGPPSEDALPADAAFDRAYAVAKVSDIVDDIKTVDHRLKDGIGVSSALSLLSDSYGRLQDAGLPPGVDKSTYYARLSTLQAFAAQAADTYDSDAMQASARYVVVRKQTGVLFQQLNTALGTDFQLP